MPSPRRFRVLVYLVLAGVVTLLFFTSQARHARDPDSRSIHDFYHRTSNALDKNHGAAQKVTAGHDVDADGDIDDEDAILAREMAERLRQAEKKAKDSARAKGPNKPEAPQDVIGVGSSASGQKKGAVGGAAEGKKPEVQESEATEVTEEEHEVEVELANIFKKSPVIIFSKSYCPYSKRAKGILLEKYIIKPAPHVVELDQHPLGPKIQARLGALTGRTTVPNVLVYEKSIGGGDEVAAMDTEKKLAGKIQSLGKKRVEVSERFVESVPKAG